jgi:hypothetical protein
MRSMQISEESLEVRYSKLCCGALATVIVRYDDVLEAGGSYRPISSQYECRNSDFRPRCRKPSFEPLAPDSRLTEKIFY